MFFFLFISNYYSFSDFFLLLLLFIQLVMLLLIIIVVKTNKNIWIRKDNFHTKKKSSFLYDFIHYLSYKYPFL